MGIVDVDGSTKTLAQELQIKQTCSPPRIRPPCKVTKHIPYIDLPISPRQNGPDCRGPGRFSSVDGEMLSIIPSHRRLRFTIALPNDCVTRNWRALSRIRALKASCQGLEQICVNTANNLPVDTIGCPVRLEFTVWDAFWAAHVVLEVERIMSTYWPKDSIQLQHVWLRVPLGTSDWVAKRLQPRACGAYGKACKGVAAESLASGQWAVIRALDEVKNIFDSRRRVGGSRFILLQRHAHVDSRSFIKWLQATLSRLEVVLLSLQTRILPLASRHGMWAWCSKTWAYQEESFLQHIERNSMVAISTLRPKVVGPPENNHQAWHMRLLITGTSVEEIARAEQQLLEVQHPTASSRLRMADCGLAINDVGGRKALQSVITMMHESQLWDRLKVDVVLIAQDCHRFWAARVPGRDFVPNVPLLKLLRCRGTGSAKGAGRDALQQVCPASAKICHADDEMFDCEGAFMIEVPLLRASRLDDLAAWFCGRPSTWRVMLELSQGATVEYRKPRTVFGGRKSLHLWMPGCLRLTHAAR